MPKQILLRDFVDDFNINSSALASSSYLSNKLALFCVYIFVFCLISEKGEGCLKGEGFC